jgi:hypothetical protein
MGPQWLRIPPSSIVPLSASERQSDWFMTVGYDVWSWEKSVRNYLNTPLAAERSSRCGPLL